MKKPAQFSISEFNKKYPNDDVCLDEIFRLRFGSMSSCPKCNTIGVKYYRMKKRKCYECGKCGNQIYPTAGTVMHGTNTKLTNWFYAIYLLTTSKNGVSNKEIQRQLGVTYKCAFNIGHKIRELMGKDEYLVQLSGVVEIDESLIGGKRVGKRGWGAENKTCLLGLVERGGKIKVVAVKDRKIKTIIPIIRKHVKAGSTINTDEYRGYNPLQKIGYEHKTVIHSRWQWRRGDAYTNTIEGYWSNLKKSIFGTHTHVSTKHLQKYLDEFSFRHNNRKENVMFEEVLKRI